MRFEVSVRIETKATLSLLGPVDTETILPR